MEATGIGFMEIIGSGLPFTVGLGGLSGYLMCHQRLWPSHQIIFWACRRDIIGYATLIFIATGGIGVVLTTGTAMLGIEIIPSIVGVTEILIGRPNVSPLVPRKRRKNRLNMPIQWTRWNRATGIRHEVDGGITFGIACQIKPINYCALTLKRVLINSNPS
jgi:hypothetical protein